MSNGVKYNDKDSIKNEKRRNNNKKQTTGIVLWKVNDIKNYMSIIKLFSAKSRFSD
mgnify:CR=1 FL=1